MAGLRSPAQEGTVKLKLIGTVQIPGAGVSVFKNLALVSQAQGSVAIVDIFNPAVPVKISEIPRYPEAGGVEETRAFQAGSRDVLVVPLGFGPNPFPSPVTGLRLFDITNPAQPVQIGFFNTQHGVLHFDVVPVRDRILGLIVSVQSEAWSSRFGSQRGLGDLQIVDLTHPENPVLLSEWGVLDEPSLGQEFFRRQQRGARATFWAERVRASADGKYVYLAYADFGVMTLNIENPARPLLVGRVGFEDDQEEGEAFDVELARGGTVLVRSHLVRWPFRIHLTSNVFVGGRVAGEGANTPPIYNLPNRTIGGQAVWVGPGCPGDAYLADPNGKIALIASEGCGLGVKAARAQLAGATAVVFFATDPLVAPDSQFPPGVPGSVSYGGSQVQITIPAMGVGNNTGLCLAQVADAGGNLLAVDCLKNSTVVLTGTSVFQGYGGVRFYDIRNPAQPSRLGTYNTPNSLDVNVALAARYPNPAFLYAASHMELVGNRLYVGWDADGLRVLDISNPSAAREIGSWTGAGAPADAPRIRAWEVHRHRGLILLSSIGYGLYILEEVP